MVESASYFPRVVTHRRNRWAPLRVFFRWKISDPDDNGSGIPPIPFVSISWAWPLLSQLGPICTIRVRWGVVRILGQRAVPRRVGKNFGPGNFPDPKRAGNYWPRRGSE